MHKNPKKIPFNKPYLSGQELAYINKAIESGKISGNGDYTKECHDYFQNKFGFSKCLLTSSCTDALEMSAILANILPGDEVIMPSYTFVSTANAFMLRGAKIVFADSEETTPNIDIRTIEPLISNKTRAIVPVHYAGVACDMDLICQLAKEAKLLVVEDAAQAVDSYYKGRPLGTFGDFSAFSFHETKNIISGEGGLIAINSQTHRNRAEIIWEKGTNRAAFWRGEVDKYGWVDIGSSFLPSEITAAFLFAQLEKLELIQLKRVALWEAYNTSLNPLKTLGVRLPFIPYYATNNAHMFYMICRSADERTELIDFLNRHGIQAVFHYQSLHKSTLFATLHDGRDLPMSDHYTDCLVRLPLYYELSLDDIQLICSKIKEFYESP